MATIGSETEQVSADPTNTVEYGSATFVKLTASTYDVELQNGNKLVIDSEKVINEVEDGVPVSIQGGYIVVDAGVVNPDLEIELDSSTDYPIPPNDYGWLYNGIELDSTGISNKSMNGTLAVPTKPDLNEFASIIIGEVRYYRVSYMVEENTPAGDVTPIGLATAYGGIPVYIALVNSQDNVYGLYAIDDNENVTPVLNTLNEHMTIELL